MKFIVDNLLDYGGTITANDEDSFFPVTNLSVRTLADKYQSTSAGSKEIQIVLNDTASILEFAIAYHNLDSGDSVTLESYPDASGFAGTPIQKVLTITDDVIYIGLDSEYFHTTKYYKILIEKNSGSYVYIGYATLATDSFFAPHVLGTIQQFETNSTEEESQGLQSYPAIRQTRIAEQYNFVTQYEQWNDLWQMLKVNKFIFLGGVILPTHKNLSLRKPYFGKIIEYNAGSKSRDGWYRYSVSTKEIF